MVRERSRWGWDLVEGGFRDVGWDGTVGRGLGSGEGLEWYKWVV